MAKRTYETPVADMLTFDYREQVRAGSGESSNDASHCFFSRNQGQCAPMNKNKCDVTSSPGTCHS